MTARCLLPGCKRTFFGKDAGWRLSCHVAIDHPQTRAADWRGRAVERVRALAGSGRSFTFAADVAPVVGEPANPKADWGRLARSLHVAGVIEPCGFTESARATSAASAVKVWRGTGVAA